MTKLWKAAGSWFGGDEPTSPQQQQQQQPPVTQAPAAVDPPAYQASSPPSAASALGNIGTIPPLDDDVSPRVVVIQGPRAIPKMAAPPPPATPASSSSPPPSPRGPLVPASATVLKAFPRAVSPAGAVRPASPEKGATMMRLKASAPTTPAPAPAPAPVEDYRPVEFAYTPAAVETAPVEFAPTPVAPKKKSR